MKSDETARAFAACAPGLEELVSSELAALGATGILRCAGGAEFTADPRLVMRANLHLRTASRVLLRLAHFPVFHLAQLDRRARRVDWACFLPLDTPIAVRASCKRSKIYHSGAAAERVLKAAIAGARARPAREGEAAIHISARIQANQCSLSLDTSGAPLHQRGAKQEVYAAPLRETLAAAFLLLAGFDGTEPLYDPMCGSGSLAIEGAWIAMQRAPGLLRSFAFERLAGFDRRAWAALEDAARRQEVPEAGAIFASDRAGAAVGTTRRNVQRAGLERVQVTRRELEAIEPPAKAGLMIVNPPYGPRLGRAHAALYAELGRVFSARFSGWRLGLITARRELAEACGLDFAWTSPPVPHGKLRLRLYCTATRPSPLRPLPTEKPGVRADDLDPLLR